MGVKHSVEGVVRVDGKRVSFRAYCANSSSTISINEGIDEEGAELEASVPTIHIDLSSDVIRQLIKQLPNHLIEVDRKGGRV